ncbi:3'5'-cyclic nucleotide phosphodiesterase family protein [Tritrichomonas foetus]|uniref:3'5'-cyclic nucleotide phosphodiesterase family protein n=1 Tax=Tritrichomonas foetus TaxID=1144522 RepID=A0A1J4KU61_9EUKA|nr:3'5'-cyclic nucleotide phosphodiesterase family protein [Tritrichomonas foetus]|eukprot:OHT14817.1 3'5'-cyclic nucleotide phosphodiesterase family protein [Tritrichomonas foetus]
MTPRKQISVRSRNNTVNLNESTTESFFSSLSSQAPPNEKTNNRTIAAQDLKLRKLDSQIKLDEAIESFLLTFPEKPMHASIESFMSSKIVSGNVIFWHEIASIQKLYSPKLDVAVSHNDTIVGFAFSHRGLLKIPIAAQHFSYNEDIDSKIVNPKSSLILFPLHDSHDNIIGVVEIQKKFTDPTITENDEKIANEFMKKFKVFSHFLMHTPAPTKSIVELMNLFEIGQFLIMFQKKMNVIFNCRVAEIWRTDKKTSISTRYINHAETIKIGDEGIIGHVSKKMQMFNCSSNKMLSSYFEPTDGEEDAALLAYPIYDRQLDSIFTIVLRGMPKKMFTTQDENILAQTAPFILTSFKNSIKFSEAIAKNEQIKTLSDLTTVLPEFGQRMKAEDIVNKSMSILETITAADRGTFYITDHKAETITSIYAKNVKDPITQRFNKGISGGVVRSADVHNTADAYEDVRFDSTTDLITGYKTKSLLTVPIVDATGMVVSIVQLLNKQDWNPFNQLDIDSSRLCGTICSCLINNAVINGRLSRLTRRTTTFFSMIPDLLNPAPDFRKTLQNLLPSIREIVKVEKIVIFVADHASNLLVPRLWDGPIDKPDAITLSSGIAASCAESNKSFFVNDITKDGRVDHTVDNNYQNICIAPLLALQDPNKHFSSSLQMKSPRGSPRVNSDSKSNDGLSRCIGVIELLDKTKGGFEDNDLMFVQCISTIFSLFFDNYKLQSVIQQGKSLWKLDQLISPAYRKKTILPPKLELPPEILNNIETLQFFSYDLMVNDGDYKFIFYIFNKFKLLETFKIDNLTLFNAIYAAKHSYKDNYYHNWMHAIDMAQLLMFEIEKGNLTTVFHPTEILALFISVIFSYSYDDGTSNSFQINSETPLGTLIGNLPLTVSHCSSAIRILSKPKCNIFSNLDSYDVKQIWKTIITLMMEIITDDVSDMIKECQKIMKTSTIDLNNRGTRQTLMIMLIKCADMAPFCRPFGINLKWQPLIMNSMFYLGDKETENGLGFSNRHNSRDHHIKALAMIEMMDKSAYPAFEALVGLRKELGILFDMTKENFQKWKDRRK